jgi:hypothetical protein
MAIPSMERPQTSSVFFVGQLKRMHTTSLLQSPPSILSKMNANLPILWDFVFQSNSDFISNLNLNRFRLLPCTYISLGAPPPHPSIPISPQNQTLAATGLHHHHWCPSSPPPLFQSHPFKLNPVPVLRSHGPNHRRKNHVET